MQILQKGNIRIEIDGHTKTTTETCLTCGASQSYEGADALHVAMYGSLFRGQHSLPDCGEQGLRSLMDNSIAIQQL